VFDKNLLSNYLNILQHVQPHGIYYKQVESNNSLKEKKEKKGMEGKGREGKMNKKHIVYRVLLW
jgi:hypothetical protein